LVTQEVQLVSIGPQQAKPGDVDVPQQFSCTACHVSEENLAPQISFRVKILHRISRFRSPETWTLNPDP